MIEGVARFVAIVALALAMAGCRASRPATSTGSLVFLTRAGCATSDVMRANLDAALRTLQPPGSYQVIDQDTLPRTDVRSAYPTPTLLYANRDLFGMPEPKPPYPEPT